MPRDGSGPHFTCVACLERQAALWAVGSAPGGSAAPGLACMACRSTFPDAALDALVMPPPTLGTDAAPSPPVLEDVPTGSIEFVAVESRFMAWRGGTAGATPASPRGRAGYFRSTALVTRVQRCVNGLLLVRYRNTRRQIREERRQRGEAGDANEMFMWHGTGDTDPELIWKSAVGGGANGIDKNYW